MGIRMAGGIGWRDCLVSRLDSLMSKTDMELIAAVASGLRCPVFWFIGQPSGYWTVLSSTKER